MTENSAYEQEIQLLKNEIIELKGGKKGENAIITDEKYRSKYIYKCITCYNHSINNLV